MVILFKKAVRAILANKKSYGACMVLCGIGIMIFVCMNISANALSVARDSYYAQCRFADVFATVKAIPKGSADKLRSVEGVNEVLGRYIYDARVVMPGSDKIIVLRLISVDTALVNPLNGILYQGGRFGGRNDLMVGNGFFTAHNLQYGDSLRLIIGGREQVFNVCAKAQSPEYIYAVKEGEIVPDPKTFDIAFVDEKTLWGLTNTRSIYNDLSFELEPGAVFIEVKTALEDELARYGMESIIEKKDQLSFLMLDSEIESNRQMSFTFPLIFLIMTVVILSIIMKRVIEQDRTQIGTLKAFGYSNNAILAHYLTFGGVTGLLGGFLGCISGFFLSGSLIAVNAELYNLPNFIRSGVKSSMLTGMVIAVISSLAGACAGALNILQLKPAEAMRPEAPKSGKNIISKFNFIYKLLLNSRGNMAMRGIARNKLRSFFTVVGISFSFGILALIGSYASFIDDMIMTQFTKIQLYDGKVSFVQPARLSQGVETIRAISGVKQAEGLLEIPVELKHSHLKNNAILTGLDQDSTLYKIHDDKLNRDLAPSGGGVILSDRLAEKLEAKRGDTIYISSRLLKDNVPVIVTEVVEISLGQVCYMTIDGIAELLNLDNFVTSVIFSGTDFGKITNYLNTAPNVLSIQDREIIMEHNREFYSPFTAMMFVMEIMAVAFAFAVIYTISSISLSERKREYATLRVLGLTVKEVGEILSFENQLLCFTGIIFGFPFAKFLAVMIASFMDMDNLKLTPDILPSAYGIALAGCIIAVFLSNKFSIRVINNFDMVEVLKDRE